MHYKLQICFIHTALVSSCLFPFSGPHMTLVIKSLWAAAISQTSLVLMTLTVLKSTCQMFSGMALHWSCLMFYSWLHLHCGFWEEDHRGGGQVPSSSTQLITAGADLDHLLKVMFTGLLLLQYCFIPCMLHSYKDRIQPLSSYAFTQLITNLNPQKKYLQVYL